MFSQSIRARLYPVQTPLPNSLKENRRPSQKGRGDGGEGHPDVSALFSQLGPTGVCHLYVHVVHDNLPAVQLYTALGFAAEAEESDALAHGLGRPRRLLLGKPL